MTTSARKPAVDKPVQRALDEMIGCENCSDSADTPFYWVVDSLGQDTPGSPAEIPADTRCPHCDSPLAGSTRVDWE